MTQARDRLSLPTIRWREERLSREVRARQEISQRRCRTDVAPPPEEREGGKLEKRLLALLLLLYIQAVLRTYPKWYCSGPERTQTADERAHFGHEKAAR